MIAPRCLVVTGDGINCERETAFAFERAGFEPDIRHLNDLAGLSTERLRERYAALAFPGGFSFGDDLGSGRVLALKIRHQLRWDVPAYAASGGVVLAVCNGFQALIKLGVFGKELGITRNLGGRFVDAWVGLRVDESASPWLDGIERLELPIRHGEGRIVAARRAFPAEARPCLWYEGDPNGSFERVAGLTDRTGRILGLMPHPEAFVSRTQHPAWTACGDVGADSPGDGLRIFENARKAVG